MYQIPSALEKLVLQGKATYKTKQLGIAEQFVLPVPRDRFIVIFGFRYIPFNPRFEETLANRDEQNDLHIVNFLTPTNFFPFIFKPNKQYINNGVDVVNVGITPEFQKSCYIVSNVDVGIYVTRAINSGRPNQQAQINLLPQQFQTTWNNPLGYGGQNAITTYSGFHADPSLNAYFFNPLPVYQTTEQLALTPGDLVFDQLFTYPAFGDLDVSGYNAVSDVNAYQNQHFLQIDYVEVSAQKPEFLEL